MKKKGTQTELYLLRHVRGWALGGAVLALSVAGVGCASTRKSPTPPLASPTSATAGATTIVAIAPPPAASCDVSIPKMLGLPQLVGGVGEVLRRIGSRMSVGLDLTGRFPGLQPQPPLVPLTDPANLDASAPPAVQAAAKIKGEEDAAPQKIMAIRYLATLGCGGCYEDVEQSLLEAMSDCTEEVRFEAVKALQCRPDCGCRFCTSPSCCSEPVRKRLEELTTCEKEPSARVNRVARLALACCQTKPLLMEDTPREGPTPAPAEEAASILGGEGDALASLFADVQLASYQSPVNYTAKNYTANYSGVVTANSESLTNSAKRSDELSQPDASARDRRATTADFGHERTLAIVNGEPIFERQVMTLVQAKKKQLAAKGQAQPSEKQLVSSELQRLIDWHLIQQLAKAEQSSVMPASAVASRDPSIVNANAYANAPGPIHLSVVETQAWLARKLAVPTDVNPTELMAYYQVHQNEFMTPARMRWECLTILEEQCKSDELVSQVAAYVKSRATGQAVNPPTGFQPSMVDIQVTAWQEQPQIPQRVREILVTLGPGQLSQPLQQDKNLCLLRLLATEPSQPMPIASVAGRITQAVLKQRRETALQNFLAQARANSKIWNALEAESALTTSIQSQPILKP